MHNIWFLVCIIVLSVTFDFINGFHDTANAIATVIATRVLSPTLAVLMSAGLNLLGALSGTAVAKTIGSGIIGTAVSQEVVAAALIGGIIWNLVTWYLGIPSSSSHALVGGLIGSGIASVGVRIVKWGVLSQKVLLPFLASPLVGFVGAYILVKVLFIIFSFLPLRHTNNFFRKSQMFSSAFMAFSHGSNDAQKTMGIITLALISTHSISANPFTVPLWVIILSASAMALGTASGGWRIIKTMGTKLFPLEPIHGFAAETAAATVIETASRFGFPLSTTHIISSSILGVGFGKRARVIRWNIVNRILQAWVLTIPVAAGISFVTFKILKLFF